MIELLTLGDLLRVFAWSVFGTMPVVLASAAIHADKKQDDAGESIAWMLCIAAQIGFGVAAYIAGAKS